MNIAVEKQAKKSKIFSIIYTLLVDCSVEREVSCQL